MADKITIACPYEPEEPTKTWKDTVCPRCSRPAKEATYFGTLRFVFCPCVPPNTIQAVPPCRS